MADASHSILVLALPGLGDYLMQEPALRMLRRQAPTARLTFLTMFDQVGELVRDAGLADEIIQFDFLRASKASSLAVLLKLRRRGFDASLLPFPSNGWFYNIASLLVGARVRTGFRHLSHPDLHFFRLNNAIIAEHPSKSNLRTNIEAVRLLLRRLGIPEPAQDAPFPGATRTAPPPSRLTFGFHAFSSTHKNMHRKCWPPAHFAELMRQLHDRFPGSRSLLFTGPSDRGTTAEILRLNPGPAEEVCLPSILEVRKVMQECSLMVSNDSGLMHLAASLGLPVVALFGPTNPGQLYGWPNPHKIVKQSLACQPCFQYSPSPLRCRAELDFACIRELPVRQAFTAAVELLQETGLHE